MTIVRSTPTPDVLLVDGEHLAYRAFYVFWTLCTSGGDPSGVFYGVLSMLRTQLERRSPKRIVLVWGAPGNGLNRKDKYPGYKATRPKRPDFQDQVASVQQFLSYLNWDQYYTDSGWEADDVIATLARFYTKAGQSVTILSGDHDFHQLVNTNVTCVVPGTKARGDTQFTPEKVLEVYGVDPPLLVDVFALCGETADNIRGVPGVGETTAQRLVAKFGAVDTWLDHVRELEITPKVRQSLWDYRELVRRNKEIIDLSARDIALCEIGRGGNRLAALGVLQEYQIKKFGVSDFVHE